MAPIRKVSDRDVALTNSTNKIFVKRTDRSAFDVNRWLIAQINLKAMDSDSDFSNVIYSPCFYRDIKLPNYYCAIAKHISTMEFKDIHLNFDYGEVNNLYPKAVIAKAKTFNGVVFGHGGGYYYAMSNDGMVVKIMENGGGVRELSVPLTVFFGIDWTKQPTDYAEVRILGKKIPLGIILAYHIGFGTLLKTAGVEVKRLDRGRKHPPLGPNEFSLKFDDEILVFDRRDQKAMLLFAGFNRVKNVLSKMSVYSLDKSAFYRVILHTLAVPERHMKNYDEMFRSWIDNMTRDELINMGEPTDMLLLFLSAIDKLCDDTYIDPNSIEGSLIRGYERIPAMMQDELNKAIRTYIRNPTKNSKIEINPNALWYRILQDETVSPIEESNPIHAIKEKEVVVFRGAGGRSAQSMTAKHRQFSKDSIGVISEAGVDNGNVGTITYLTTDPNITNLRGRMEPLKSLDDVAKAKLQSTAMLVSAGSDGDDPKRTSFTNIMFTSSTFLYKSKANRVQTGGEKYIADRADDTWAVSAKASGKIVKVTKDFLTVDYGDGEEVNLPIGRYFGTWSGTTIPHSIVTPYGIGDTFHEGDILTYNEHWFEPDPFNKGGVVFKRGTTGTMALIEDVFTLEDACMVSRKFSEELVTGVSEKVFVKVDSDNTIEMLTKEGQEVTSETILCNLRPPLSGFGDSYHKGGQAALETLRKYTPSAGYNGIIDQIEVMYTCDVDEMTDSLKDVVSASDTRLYKRNKALKGQVRSAYVDPTYRIENTDIGENKVVLSYKVTTRVGAGVGDKLVFCNQMKSIISSVLNEPHVAKDGTPIDIVFSRRSISNRIVNSMDLINTSNTVLSLAEKQFINITRGKATA